MYIQSVFFLLIALAVSPLYENENQNVDIDLLFEKALESHNNLKLNDALFYFDEILKHDPDNILALNNKGGVLVQLERYDDALPYFEKVIEINPDFVEAIINKSATLYYLNRSVDGLATVYDAYKIDPSNIVIAENLTLIIDEMPFVREISYAILEVRNSDDQLVGYAETQRLAFKDPLAFMFLEDNAEWKPIEINGEEFEVLEHSVNYPVPKSGLSATTNIGLSATTNIGFMEKDSAYPIFVIRTEHDGFLTAGGDTMIVTIILLRPG